MRNGSEEVSASHLLSAHPVCIVLISRLSTFPQLRAYPKEQAVCYKQDAQICWRGDDQETVYKLISSFLTILCSNLARQNPAVENAKD